MQFKCGPYTLHYFKSHYFSLCLLISLNYTNYILITLQKDPNSCLPPPETIRATIAELVSTFIFVFIGEGSSLALGRYPLLNYGDSGSSGGELVCVALAHAFGLFAAISASVQVSGGHVNPAVTFGALAGGRIPVVRAVLYWIAQLVGAILAALVLRLATANMRPATFDLQSGIGPGHGLIFEIIMTFGLMYTVYATALDPKRGSSIGAIAPLAIGFIVGANILAGGPFDGACMNPARAFGPALVGGRWHYHWIYWVGPFIGAGLAAILYEYTVIPVEPLTHPHHQPLAPLCLYVVLHWLFFSFEVSNIQSFLTSMSCLVCSSSGPFSHNRTFG